MYLMLLLFAALPPGNQPEQVFKPDVAIVADEIDQFDGTVTRNIYCFKVGKNKETGKDEMQMIGNMATYPENIKVRDNKIIWKKMEIHPKKLLTYKGAPDPIRDYVKQFNTAEKLWFGAPMNFQWICPCCP